jgi:hypothetical protein
MKKLFLPVFLIILYFGSAIQSSQAVTYGEAKKITDTAISEHNQCYDEYGERSIWCSTAEERELTWTGKGFLIIILLVVMLIAFSIAPILVSGLFILTIILIIGSFIINLSLITWITLLSIFGAFFVWANYSLKLEKKCLKGLYLYEFNELMVLIRHLGIHNIYGESVDHQRIKNKEVNQHISDSVIEKKIDLCKALNEFSDIRKKYTPPENNNIVLAHDVENLLTKNEPEFFKLRNADLQMLVSNFGGYSKSNYRKNDLQQQMYKLSGFWINNGVYGDVNNNKDYHDNFLEHIKGCIKIFEKYAKEKDGVERYQSIQTELDNIK